MYNKIDEKTIIYNGKRYKKNNSGYYSNCSEGALHRKIYKDHVGEILDRNEIHHKDFDKENNMPDNLMQLSRKEHAKIHREAQTEEQIKAKRENLIKNVSPKAKKWHKSEDGKKWHKKHYENMKDKLHKEKKYKCVECGKIYTSTNVKSKFCTPNCRSKNRRKSGVDNINFKCECCGIIFIANKYSKQKCCSISCANKIRAR